jgi:hypothetical protein
MRLLKRLEREVSQAPSKHIEHQITATAKMTSIPNITTEGRKQLLKIPGPTLMNANQGCTCKTPRDVSSPTFPSEMFRSAAPRFHFL